MAYHTPRFLTTTTRPARLQIIFGVSCRLAGTHTTYALIFVLQNNPSMPVDIAIILLGGILTVRSIVANHSTNANDPVTRARDTLDRIRIILDCLKANLRELSEESEQGQYYFDDHAEEYDISEYADLKQAWKE